MLKDRLSVLHFGKMSFNLAGGNVSVWHKLAVSTCV